MQTHICRACGETCFNPPDLMLRTGIRHWKHFRCLTDQEVTLMKPSDKRRYETWGLDHPLEIATREKKRIAQ